MTDNQKKELRAWEAKQRFEMPQGGRMTLQFILEEERKRAKNNPTGLALPEFMTNVHPALYYIFIVDWQHLCVKRIPTKYRGDGAQFGRDVVDDWLSVCDKKSYYKEGMLSGYDHIDQIKEVMSRLLAPDGVTYKDPNRETSYDYTQMEERMYEIRQRAIDAQRQADIKAEEERKLQEEARRKQEAAERKQRKADAERAAAERQRQLAAPSVEDLMLEVQQLLDQMPVMQPSLRLSVVTERASDPYTASLHWGLADKQQVYSFYGDSFASVIALARAKASAIIDQEIQRRQRAKERDEIQKKIDEQNTSFALVMEENKKMMEQFQQQMAAQQRQHEEAISRLRAQIKTLV